MIQPILHRLLIKADLVEETDEVLKKAKAIGLQLLEKDKSREQAAAETGEVVAIGSTCFVDYGASNDLIKIGDKVAFAKYAGKKVVDKDGTEYLILNDEDIVAIIRG